MCSSTNFHLYYGNETEVFTRFFPKHQRILECLTQIELLYVSVSVLLLNKVKLRDLALFFQHFPDGYLPEHIRASLECWSCQKIQRIWMFAHYFSFWRSEGSRIRNRHIEEATTTGGSLMCHKASTVFQGNQRIPKRVK